MASAHPWIRTRLWVMMFLEFLLWGSWYVAVGGYMNGTLRFSGAEIGWIYATTAIGAISRRCWSATWPTACSPPNGCWPCCT